MGSTSSRIVQWIGSYNSLFLHTIFFIVMLALAFLDVDFDKVMLILTTVVSLEAIYLAIFIQMTVNKHAAELEEVSEDIDEIQEDIDEIQEDIEDDEDEDKILGRVENTLGKLIEEVMELKKHQNGK